MFFPCTAGIDRLPVSQSWVPFRGVGGIVMVLQVAARPLKADPVVGTAARLRPLYQVALPIHGEQCSPASSIRYSRFPKP